VPLYSALSASEEEEERRVEVMGFIAKRKDLPSLMM
jgi:hypothetical protein